MPDSLSQLTEKFTIEEKCVHCGRNFNLFSYFSSHSSECENPDTTLNLPLLLACGDSACEKCVMVENKNSVCCYEECLHYRNEYEKEPIWKNPYNLYWIDCCKEKIRKSLNDAEIHPAFSNNCFEIIKKTVENAQIAIQGGMMAISYKSAKRCSDVLASYISPIQKIYEMTELRANNFDVDIMVEKLELSKAIFEDERALKDNLKADLSAVTQALPPIVILKKIINFQATNMEYKIKTIVNMVKNGTEVAVGRRYGNEILWAPVSVVESNLYISRMTRSFKPSDTAVRMQYNWLVAERDEGFVFLEITIHKYFIKKYNISTAIPHKFKLIIKTNNFSDDVRVDKDLRDSVLTSAFRQTLIGGLSENLVGIGVLFLENCMNICRSLGAKGGLFVRETNNIRQRFVYGYLKDTDMAELQIAAEDNLVEETQRVFAAKVVSGIHNISKICEQIRALKGEILEDNEEDLSDVRDESIMEGMEWKTVKVHGTISDCGLVITSNSYVSKLWDESAWPKENESDDESC